MAEYSVEFWTLAADSKWNEEALQGVFVYGLNESVKDELATRDELSDLFRLVSLADNRLRERRREKRREKRRERSGQSHKSGRAFAPQVPPTSPPQRRLPFPGPVTAPRKEPMQLGCARLTPSERLQRLQAGECLYCGDASHFLASCPKRPKDQAR